MIWKKASNFARLPRFVNNGRTFARPLDDLNLVCQLDQGVPARRLPISLIRQSLCYFGFVVMRTKKQLQEILFARIEDVVQGVRSRKRLPISLDRPRVTTLLPLLFVVNDSHTFTRL